MAPRLSRWVVVTAATAAVIAAMLLTAGGTPLVFLSGSRGMWQEPERSALDLRIHAIGVALDETRARRAQLVRQAQLTAAFAKTSADPIVLRAEGGRLVPVPAYTAAADSLWRALPIRRPEVRTVILLGQGGLEWRSGKSGLDDAGDCIVNAGPGAEDRSWLEQVRGFGGECFLAEQFGPPGRAWERWFSDVPSGVQWDRGQDYWSVDGNPGRGRYAYPAWFESGDELPSLIAGGDFGWRPATRAYVACLVGRTDQCGGAFGTTATGWLDPHSRFGWMSSRILPTALLPRALLRDLGPEKFGKLWRADSSIEAGYAGATSGSLDEWLGRWARRTDGEVERDNAISLVGWLGALLWIGLLGGMVAGRLRARAAT